MRLRSERRSERLLRRWPRLTAASAVELVLLALIAVQAARLVWTLVTPVGPVGDWRVAGTFSPPSDAVLAQFDPFFRLSPASGPAVVTGLNLKLYGVREDRATGHGSAIIALPDGTQRSFGVGEEIMPGVTLAEVASDNVTISRGGVREQIFLDQSQAAPVAPGQAAAAPTAPPFAAPPPVVQAPPAPSPAIRVQPRVGDSRVDGLVVGPGADGGQAFRSAGFAVGDVIVSINGQRVTSAEQARALARASGGMADVIVNRGGRAVSMRVRLDL